MNRQRRVAQGERDAANEARTRAELAEKTAAERAQQLERRAYLFELANAQAALAIGDVREATARLRECPAPEPGVHLGPSSVLLHSVEVMAFHF